MRDEYGYRWIEVHCRYVVGARVGDAFVPQPDDYQPKGHWVDQSGKRYLFLEKKQLGLSGRIGLRLAGFRWISYKKEPRPMNEV